MKVSSILTIVLALIFLSVPACQMQKEESTEGHNLIVVTSPKAKDVILTQPFVCQIRAKRHIEVCALSGGFLEEIKIKEGQAVEENEVLFQIVPVLYEAKWAAEKAERDLAQLEYMNTQQLSTGGVKAVVSQKEVALFKAKLDKAEAKLKQSKAELDFTTVKAKFPGIIDKLYKQQGSLIKEGETLTTLSDNSVMWVYFNVPEARYLDYMKELGLYDKVDRKGKLEGAKMEALLAELNRREIVELVLANGEKFQEPGKFSAIEAKFNNETGTIPFRADFPNPDRLLRHGQTGNVWIKRTMKNAIVIPQRATFEILDKQYVWVVGEDSVAHQREIVVLHELEDIYVIKSGVGVNDKIVFEGVRQVRNGQKVEYEFRDPEQILKNQKNRAE